VIRQIKLINFKVHRNSTINFDQHLTIVTGENNSGKSSLLEGLLIFEECYRFTKHTIKKNTSGNVKKGLLQVGDFDFQSRFVSCFESVRSNDYSEVFYKDSNQIEIEINFELLDKSFAIGYKISKGRNGTVYQIVPQVSDDSLNILNYSLSDDCFSFIKSSPISSILQNEYFLPPIQVEKEVSKGNNLSVLRNRLRMLEPSVVVDIQNQVAKILGYQSFELRVLYDVNHDLYVSAQCRINDQESQDLALLGSGALQLIEVLISIQLSGNTTFKVILLDEPDSHLHRLAQRRLVNTLRNIVGGSAQVILTTHNEQLVMSAKSGELIHLYAADEMLATPIVAEFKSGRGKGFIENSQLNDIYSTLGVSASAMQYLEAIESDVVVFVEGRSDAKFIELLQAKRESLPFIAHSNKKVSFWSLGSITDLPSKLLHWKEILKDIKNNCSIWDKAVILIDMDYTSTDEMEALKENIQQRYHVDMLYWQCYTIESLLLEDLNLFCKAFATVFDISIDDVNRTVQNLLADISLDDYKDNISKQRVQREKSYSIFSDKRLKLNDGVNFSSYLNLLKNSNRLASLLFGKKDMHKLLANMVNDLELEVDVDMDNLLLLVFANIDTIPPSWNNILKRIYD